MTINFVLSWWCLAVLDYIVLYSIVLHLTLVRNVTYFSYSKSGKRGLNIGISKYLHVAAVICFMVKEIDRVESVTHKMFYLPLSGRNLQQLRVSFLLLLIFQISNQKASPPMPLPLELPNLSLYIGPIL